jgi:hypothetical protein
MSFEYPSFLWALLLLAIPIIIHLFNFRKTIRVFFSNTRFLRQIKEETTQKRKLKQYLVLASRLLFLLFLVLAFAQPFLPAPRQAATGNSKIIYLDNSYSLSAPAVNSARAIETSIDMAQGILRASPPGSRFKIITNDFAPFSNAYKTVAEASDWLTQLRLSAVGRSSAEVLQRIGREDAFADEVFWISDFQKTTFQLEPTAFDTTRQWHLAPVKLTNSSNVFVDTLFFENPYVVGGEQNTAQVRLRNAGTKAIEGLVVKLSLNRVQAGTASLSMPPLGTGQVRFDLPAGLRGRNQGIINFNDYPVSFDNDFFFSLNFTRQVNVVEVKMPTTLPYVEKVFANRELFAFRNFLVSNIDYSALAAADLVVVNALPRIDNALLAVLQARQRAGRPMLIIPAAQPELTSYQLLSAQPIGMATATAIEVLEKPDVRHPFFQNVFEDDRSATLTMPAARAVWQWRAGNSALMQFKSGNPFLDQQGSTFWLAAPLQAEYTNFFNHALFVPVMYRIAAFQNRKEQQSYYPLHTTLVTVLADSLTGDQPVKLAGAQELVPTQRRSPGSVALELPRFMMDKGFYYALHGADTLDLLAFNLDKAESNLLQHTRADLQRELNGPHISFFEAASGADVQREIEQYHQGTPLWKVALLLALLFLLAEVMLLRWMR